MCLRVVGATRTNGLVGLRGIVAQGSQAGTFSLRGSTRCDAARPRSGHSHLASAVGAVMSLRTAVGAALSRNLALDCRFAVALADNFSTMFRITFPLCFRVKQHLALSCVPPVFFDTRRVFVGIAPPSTSGIACPGLTSGASLRTIAGSSLSARDHCHVWS